MARMIVFGLMLVVFGQPLAASSSQEDKEPQLRDNGLFGDCPAGQLFSLFFKQCRDLPGIPAVDGKCPNDSLAYTYRGEMRCVVMERGADVSGKCPTGSYFSISFTRCLHLAGIGPADNKCPEDDITYTHRGAMRCYPMTHAVTECPKGQYYSDTLDRCQVMPGALVSAETCHEDDSTYTYNGETRCWPMIHVLQ